MSEKTVTEREAVLRERRAYEKGATSWSDQGPAYTKQRCRQDAAFLYPLSPITRRRVLNVTDNFQARVREDASQRFPFEYRQWHMREWLAMSIDRKYATPGTIYGDLLLSPDEQVPDDGGAE